MSDCHVCGNEIEPDLLKCPFCEVPQKRQTVRPGVVYRHKKVNLELGRPFVEDAIEKLRANVEIARHEGVCVLTVIHGYGSSGKGGKIRVESRKMLDFMMESGEIQSYILGEEFNRKDASVKIALRRFPQLSKHPSINRRNPGITIVVL